MRSSWGKLPESQTKHFYGFPQALPLHLVEKLKHTIMGGSVEASRHYYSRFSRLFFSLWIQSIRKSMSKLSSEISHEKTQSRNTYQILLSNCNKKSEKAEILLEAPLSQKLSRLVLLMKGSFRWKGPVTLPFLISLPLFEFIIHLEQNLVRIFLLIVAR